METFQVPSSCADAAFASGEATKKIPATSIPSQRTMVGSFPFWEKHKFGAARYSRPRASVGRSRQDQFIPRAEEIQSEWRLDRRSTHQLERMFPILERQRDRTFDTLRFVDGQDHFQRRPPVVHAAERLAVLFER